MIISRIRSTRRTRGQRSTPPINFHGLRHTWASHAVMNGMPLIVVAKNLGHSTTTDGRKALRPSCALVHLAGGAGARAEIRREFSRQCKKTSR